MHQKPDNFVIKEKVKNFLKKSCFDRFDKSLPSKSSAFRITNDLTSFVRIVYGERYDFVKNTSVQMIFFHEKSFNEITS